MSLTDVINQPEETIKKNKNLRKTSKRLRRSILKEVFENDKGRCHWCGKELIMPIKGEKRDLATCATVDHLKSMLQGRKDYFDGGHVVSCVRCNQWRNTAELINTKFKILGKPEIDFPNGKDPKKVLKELRIPYPDRKISKYEMIQISTINGKE